MSYFGFLAIFLLIPIFILSGITIYDRRHGRELPPRLRYWPPLGAIALHVLLALAYTTPWDNYLVATNVWWYDPALVTGLVIGWVPIEEYTFFVLQPILGGLWLLVWARRIPVADEGPLRPWLRQGSLAVAGLIWLAAVLILVGGWQPGTYLALELSWALLPIMLQLGFGADILWRYRRLVLVTLVPLTLYLSAADALAINWGTWTIDPAQSTGILLGNLPVEEFIFFLLTNTLISFGITLILARESHERFGALRQHFSAWRRPWTRLPDVE